MRFLRSGHNPDIMDCKFVTGEGSRLVRAEYVHRRGLIDRRKSSRKDSKLCERSGPEGGGEGESSRESHRDSSQNGGEYKRDCLAPGHTTELGIGNQTGDDDAIEDR